MLLERITFLWKRLGFLTKVSLRNVLRYKQRFFMMVLGIGGCTALLLTGFGIKDSIANVVDYQFEEITLYDAAVSFTEEMDAQTQQAFPGRAADVSAVVFLHDGSVTVEAGGGAKTVNLLVPQSSLEGMMDLHRGGEKLSMPGTGEDAAQRRSGGGAGSVRGGHRDPAGQRHEHPDGDGQRHL